MSKKGLDSVPVDDQAPSESAPVADRTAPSALGPNQVAASPAQSSRPAFGRPAPAAPATPAGAVASSSRPAFGRPQPPSRPAPGPVSQSTRPPSVAPTRPAVMRPSPSAPPAPAAAAPVAAAPASTPQAFNAPNATVDTGRVSAQPPAPQAVSDLFHGYTKLISENSRRGDGLPLRLERLIDEISDFQGYSDDHRENAKSRALSDPSTWEKKLSDYYVNTIRPQRARTAQTLEEARRKNPDKIVYVSVEKGQPSIQAFGRETERGREEAILDGATVETVFATRTPFVAPRDLFGAADAKQELDSSAVEEAFGEPSVASKAPRP